MNMRVARDLHVVSTATIFFCFAVSLSQLDGEDWPHWRGPLRNDHSTETSGWRDGQWISNKPAWSIQLGEGSSSPIVADGKLYTMGWNRDREYVYCVDASTGKRLWDESYEAPRYGRHATGDQGLYSGPSSTPEFDSSTGWLYTLGNDGDVHAWDVASSKPLKKWHINLYDQYKVKRRPKVGRSGLRDYGYTSSPLVIDNTVILEVGASTGTLMGFDKRNGRELWRSQVTSPAGHNGGPVPMTVDGIPCVAVHHFDGLLVARIDRGHEGETVAEVPWRTEFGNNIATVAVHQNSVLLTSAYNHYRFARYDVSLNGAKQIWSVEQASKVCSPVIHQGSIYWAWRKMYCLDFATGQIRWQGGKYGDPGSCIVTADDRLISWANNGDLTLVDSAKLSPDKYVELARLTKLGRRDAWPHVVLAEGCLYCKDRSGQILCFKL